MADPLPRQEQEIVLSTIDKGKVSLKLFDRINVDDVFGHLVRREIFRVISGQDEGVAVDPLFKEFLLTERFTTGQ